MSLSDYWQPQLDQIIRKTGSVGNSVSCFPPFLMVLLVRSGQDSGSTPAALRIDHEMALAMLLGLKWRAT
jgi:hypothetical protein